MVASRKWTFQEAHRGQAVVRLIVRVGLAMSPKARRRNASMHIKTVGNLLKQLLSYVMLFLSGFAVFVAFSPVYPGSCF
ncbi:hypothetical protein HMPREF0168_0926 [Bifidobacterium dentium ATCC 27679]|uniref:Uncharacterized protein n=1 Tax=Bifidobacterium dentium ATCC 27679 TaxID=871562 RepID=E0Q718_9BIFI|nr:hypothetical protein HMPREF0168_0926 [Bifidobacterium dentium ATCC 27679]